MTTSVIMLTVAAVVALALRTLGVASAQDLTLQLLAKHQQMLPLLLVLYDNSTCWAI
jgi:hypothetical protein